MGNDSKEAQGARLKQARELKFEYATDAARALGMRYQTYAPYEQGRTGFSHHAPRLAVFFGVNLRWLLTGLGPMRPGDPHPVVEIFEQIPPEKQPQVIEFMKLYASNKS